MTGRPPGPHLARSALQPAWPWDTAAAPARERCAKAAALPRSRSSRQGWAATRGRLAPAHHRFSVPQGRPPHPGCWRRGSGCKEALGLTERKKPVPGPAVASRLRSALPSPGKGRRGTTCCAHGAGARGGRSGRRIGASPPLACHVFNIAH